MVGDLVFHIDWKSHVVVFDEPGGDHGVFVGEGMVVAGGEFVEDDAEVPEELSP